MASERITDRLRETLALFEAAGAPLTTPEVADRLDIGRRSTYERLDRLAEYGRLETKKVGANARVWWRPAEGAGAPPSDRSAATGRLFDEVFDAVEVGIFVLDEDREVVQVNEPAERYFGIDRADILGRTRRALVDDRLAPTVEDSAGFAAALCSTDEDDSAPEPFECRVLPGPDRAERWLEHEREPITSGPYAGGCIECYYDITDRTRSEHARRGARQEFSSLVHAVEEYAIFRLDPAGYVTSWNPGVARIKGYAADEILGEHFSTFYTEEARDAGVPERNLEAAAEHGSTEDEGWRITADGSRFWANVTITAIRDDDGELRGYAKVTREMTERRERERQLRRERNLTEQLFETAPVRLAIFDADGTIERMNARARTRLGVADVDDFEFEGLNPADPDGRPIPLAAHPVSRAIDTGEPVSEQLIQHDDANGDRRWVSLTVAPLFDDDGQLERAVVAGKDVTDLKRTERQLERQRDELEHELEEIFERVDDAFYALDDEFRFTYVNDIAEAYLEATRDELLGQRLWSALDLDEDDPLVTSFESAMAAQTPTSMERYDDSLGIWTLVRIYPSETGLSVYFRDVTARKDRERQLEESRNRYRTLIEHFPNGAVALVDPDLRYTTVGGTPIEGVKSSASELEERSLRDALSPELAELLVPRYTDALAGEPSSFERTVGDRSYQFRILPVRNDDGEVFGALGMSQDITHRKAREEQLAALNHLNEVSRDITSAVIDQSTRTEIEQTVCERIAGTDSYRFAWIGEVNPVTQTVDVRSEAGVEGYLDEITISVDPDDDRSEGPTGRALRTGAVQVTHDIRMDDRHDPWREYVESFGFRSSAAIPIKHEDTVYGALNVYAGRPSAFEGPERDVIGQLGEVIGHAIASVERKQALLSDEVVELHFRMRDIFSALDAPIEAAGPISLDHVVSVEDGTFLVYGTAADGAIDTVTGLVDVLPHWDAVTVYTDGPPAHFEVCLIDPPVLSAIASHGGYVAEATIEEGDYQMTVHLAPSTDVRQVIDAIRDAYPEVEMLRRRQISRPRNEFGQLNERLATDLTDRQRTALETAAHAGYFEWPRDNTAEDIADSLGLASATFHQHLRKAQQKVFTALLSDPLPSTD